MLRFATLLTAAMLVAAPDARAQAALAGPEPAPLAAARGAPETAGDRPGPLLDRLGAGVRPEAPAVAARNDVTGETAMLRRRARFSRAETYMIVGGATFLTGAIIGDDAGTVIMVGGAAVGLYGLYLYLQQQ